MYNAHPYFSLKNLGKTVQIIQGKIWFVLFNKFGLKSCSGIDIVTFLFVYAYQI